MKRFLIGVAIFVMGLGGFIAVNVLLAYFSAGPNEVTGIAMVLAPDTIVSSVVLITLLVILSVWLSGRLVKR